MTAAAGLLVAGTAAALAVAAGVLALLLRRGPVRRKARARRLAARGADRAEIARRTGLPQDAVGMLLQGSPVLRARQNRPPAARTAAPAAGRAARGRSTQVFDEAQLARSVRALGGGARRLPLPAGGDRRPEPAWEAA